jgi:CRP-like cAMP-binding protein
VASRVAVVERLPIVAGAPALVVEQLASSSQTFPLPAGVDVVVQGAPAHAFYAVMEGRVVVNRDGREVAWLGPGDHFGELALISERVRSATVTADGPLHCLVMAFWDFRQFARQNPDVTWKLLQHLVDLLTEERSKRAQASLQAS